MKKNRKESREKKSGFSIRKAFNKLNNKYEEILERSDPIYLDPIHKKEEKEEEKLLVRGGIDIYFLIIVVAISIIGAVMAYSASAYTGEYYYGDSLYYLKRHLIFLGIGVMISLVFVLYARPWFWKFFGIGSYIASVFLLIIVLLVGRSGNGAQRWIQIGPLTIQPSEIAKLSIVLLLALVMAKNEKKINLSQRHGGSFKYGVLYPGVIIAVIGGLVILEKHLSGLIIIGLLGLTIMFLGGTDWRWLALICGAGVAVVILALIFLPYTRDRVITWINISNADPSGSAYQTLQGMYAIGSGGLFGVGLGNSQQKYGYIPEPQNDFIFTIVCEELGFIGAALVIGLFVLLLWRGYVIASKAPDKFTSLVVYGLTTKVALQTALNIAVVTNFMPNTGISLPFFSSGGTALILQIFEMGIILNISRFSNVKK